MRIIIRPLAAAALLTLAGCVYPDPGGYYAPIAYSYSDYSYGWHHHWRGDPGHGGGFHGGHFGGFGGNGGFGGHGGFGGGHGRG
jgi:hypothetical protein